MRKYQIVKKNEDFSDIINSSAYFKNKYYAIYYRNNELDIPRFGLAVSKKCGNAVERNLLKRRLRCIIDNNMDLFENKDYIVVVRKNIVSLNYAEMENYFVLLFKERKNNEKN